MPLRELEHLFTGTREKRYAKGQVILYPGDMLNHVYFVSAGYCKMYVINEQGEERTLMIFPPKTAFPLFPRRKNTEKYELKYYYQAMSDVKVFELTQEAFNDILLKNHDATYLVLEFVAQLSDEILGRLEIIENKDAASKITNVLRYLIRISGKEIRPNTFKLSVKVTHQDIASMAGVTRETASAQIKQLETDKILEQKRDKRLVIYESLLPA